MRCSRCQPSLRLLTLPPINWKPPFAQRAVRLATPFAAAGGPSVSQRRGSAVLQVLRPGRWCLESHVWLRLEHQRLLPAAQPPSAPALPGWSGRQRQRLRLRRHRWQNERRRGVRVRRMLSDKVCPVPCFTCTLSAYLHEVPALACLPSCCPNQCASYKGTAARGSSLHSRDQQEGRVLDGECQCNLHVSALMYVVTWQKSEMWGAVRVPEHVSLALAAAPPQQACHTLVCVGPPPTPPLSSFWYLLVLARAPTASSACRRRQAKPALAMPSRRGAAGLSSRR